MDKIVKKELEDAYAKKHLDNWPLNWRAWGSWFSWGSPVGLGLFYALVAVSTGVFIWLTHLHK